MQNPMSDARFSAIIEAYGAQPQRWPENERAAGLLFMQQNPEIARRALSEARTLDAWLSASDEVEAPVSLQWQVLAQMMPAVAAPRVPVRPRRKRWLAGGLGLAAACAAGIIFGVNVGLMTTSEARAEAVLASASLTEVDNW